MARIKERDRKARNEAIIASYNITHNISATAEETGVSRETCKKALVAAGIDTKAVKIQCRITEVNSVSMYTINNEFVCNFTSISHAVEYLRQQGFSKAHSSGITRVLQGNGATAYGYKWRYQNEELNNAPYQYAQRRPVHMYTLSGEYVRTFPSFASAAKQLNIHAMGVSLACAGKLHSAGGYQWRYADTETEIPEAITPCRKKQEKSVIMYSLSGEKLQEFDSIISAAQYLHTQTNKNLRSLSSSIQTAVAGKIQTACGYQWRYADTENQIPEDISSFKQEHPGKAITMCSLSGEELKTFHSVTAAAEYLVSVGLSTSAISAKRTLSYTINGKYKTAFGYQWQLIDDDTEVIALNIANRPGTAVTMYSLSGETLKTFHSIVAAAEYLTSVGQCASVASAKSVISDVINGRQKTAYGYKWERFKGE